MSKKKEKSKEKEKKEGKRDSQGVYIPTEEEVEEKRNWSEMNKL